MPYKDQAVAAAYYRERELRRRADPEWVMAERVRGRKRDHALRADPDRRAAQLDVKKAWRLANPDKQSAYDRKCKALHPDTDRKWRAANPTKSAAYSAKWNAQNPEKRLASSVEWRARNPEKSAAIKAAWLAKNPGKSAFYCAGRKAAKLQATPSWAEPELMELVYAEAAHRSMHVDHIIPLRGKNVCGLHIYNNTQLLTKSENSRKHNKFVLGKI